MKGSGFSPIAVCSASLQAVRPLGSSASKQVGSVGRWLEDNAGTVTTPVVIQTPCRAQIENNAKTININNDIALFADEPHVPAPLLGMDQVVLLPHVGSATHETRQAMGDLCKANLDHWFAGKGVLTLIPELV